MPASASRAHAFAFAALALVVLLSATQPADAHPRDMKRIPNGMMVMRGTTPWPASGHCTPDGKKHKHHGGDDMPAMATAPAAGARRLLDGSHINYFGKDYHHAKKEWHRLCHMDSDDDGYHNGWELGDPCCVWKIDDTPARQDDITHPSYADRFPPPPPPPPNPNPSSRTAKH
eukprot:tig00000178_g12794.t1